MADRYFTTIEIGTTWLPSRVVLLDLTSGESELTGWDKYGNLAVWLGTGGRTAPTLPTPPVPSPWPEHYTPPTLVTGTIALSNIVTGASPQTTITGTLLAAETALMAQGRLDLQWDVWDNGTPSVSTRAFVGEIFVRGQAPP